MSFSKNDSMCLKGLAILIMMYHHCFATAERFSEYTISFSPFSEDAMVPFFYYGKICVSLFVFITGYGLYRSVENSLGDRISISRWTTKRLIKLIGGFFFVYVLSFLFCQLYAQIPEHIYFQDGQIRGITYILIDALGLSGITATPTLNSTWWYMSAAIVYIVVVLMLLRVLRRSGYVPVLLIVMAIPRMLNMAFPREDNPYMGFPGGTSPYTFLVPLLLGMAFSEYNLFDKLKERHEHRSMSIKFGVFLVETTAVVALVGICMNVPRAIMWEVHYGFTPLLIVIYVWKYVLWIPGVRQILRFIGIHSMTIFLTHTFIRVDFCADFIYGFKYFLVVPAVLLISSLLLAVLLDFVKRIIKWDSFMGALAERCTKGFDCFYEREGNR